MKVARPAGCMSCSTTLRKKLQSMAALRRCRKKSFSIVQTNKQKWCACSLLLPPLAVCGSPRSSMPRIAQAQFHQPLPRDHKKICVAHTCRDGTEQPARRQTGHLPLLLHVCDAHEVLGVDLLWLLFRADFVAIGLADSPVAICHSAFGCQ